MKPTILVVVFIHKNEVWIGKCHVYYLLFAHGGGVAVRRQAKASKQRKVSNIMRRLYHSRVSSAWFTWVSRVTAAEEKREAVDRLGRIVAVWLRQKKHSVRGRRLWPTSQDSGTLS